MSEIRWRLPHDLLERSIEIMRPHGIRGNEGLALWLAKGDGPEVEITELIEVFGAGFRTTPLYLSLSLRAMATLTDVASRRGSFLAGQAHSHPESFVELSELDKAHGIRVPNYLSVVCPDYAQRSLSGLEECGVHVFETDRYRRLPQAEIARRISFSGASVTLLRQEVPA
jgi:hypothetical protein